MVNIISNVCFSVSCDRKDKCKTHVRNCTNKNNENNIIEYNDYSTYGSVTISTDGVSENYWCGPKGGYKMFKPIDNNNQLNNEVRSKSVLTDYPDIPFSGGQTGWICPKCGRVMAPTQYYCLWCCNKNSSTVVTNGTDPNPYKGPTTISNGFSAEWTNKDALNKE